MASLDDLVKATRSKRVQVADLPDAPKLQPTIRSGGQYTVAVQQAGRNKLMDLAEALSKVTPTLQQYGAIRKAERDYQREQGELFAMEQPEKAMATLEAQRDKTRQELRKLREQGIIDERSDPEFMLGIRAARAKVQANEFRNTLLTDAEALQTDNPTGLAQERIAEFMQGLESEYAKQSVAPILESIGNEFTNNVINRQQDAAIAQGKTDWLNVAGDQIKAWTNGEADLNSPEFREWVNDPAGAFKGSKEFAFNELIRPALMDMVENGNTAGAMLKAQELKDWKINEKGAKFVNSTMQDSLNALERTIITEGAYWRNQTITTYNTVREDALAPFKAEFQARLNDGKPVTQNYLKDWSSRVREEMQGRVRPSDVEDFIGSQIAEANKPHFRGDQELVSDTATEAGIRQALNLGLDQYQAIEDAYDADLLSHGDYMALKKANAAETDFAKEVMSRESVRSASDIIENSFSDNRVQGGVTLAGIQNRSNFIKKLLKVPDVMEGGDPLAHEIPGVTLGIMREKAMLQYKNAMRSKRDAIVLEGMGGLSRPQLDQRIDATALETYQEIVPQIEEEVKTLLRSGDYDLGLTARHMRDYKAGLKGHLNNVLEGLGFDAEDKSGRKTFLNNYISRFIGPID